MSIPASELTDVVARLQQLPNGYWAGDLLVRMPGWPDQRFESNSFHNVGEALDWVRLTTETTVAAAAGP